MTETPAPEPSKPEPRDGELLSGPGAGLSATGPTTPGEATGSDYGDPSGESTGESAESAETAESGGPADGGS